MKFVIVLVFFFFFLFFVFSEQYLHFCLKFEILNQYDAFLQWYIDFIGMRDNDLSVLSSMHMLIPPYPTITVLIYFKILFSFTFEQSFSETVCFIDYSYLFILNIYLFVLNL